MEKLHSDLTLWFYIILFLPFHFYVDFSMGITLAKEFSSVKCIYAHLNFWNFVNINLLPPNFYLSEDFVYGFPHVKLKFINILVDSLIMPFNV